MRHDSGDAREARRRQLVAAFVAVAAHGVLLLGVIGLRRQPVPARPVQVLIDLVPAPELPATPVDEVPKAEERRRSTPRTHKSERIFEEPARAPLRGEPEVPTDGHAGPAVVDLTGETLVTGMSPAKGGTAGGEGDSPGSARSHRDRSGSMRNIGDSGPDRSGGVSLDDENWSCSWPQEADSEQIDEQTVVIRAVVRADGTAESIEIVFDPGHGFGQAAAACALRTRFTPAHGRGGDVIRAKSPPIRVRFIR